jgi:hypothetical protein
MVSDGNGNVTLARLDERIGGLREDVKALTMQVAVRLDNHDNRIAEVEKEVIRHSEQLSWWSKAQAAFTILAAGLAGWWGNRP